MEKYFLSFIILAHVGILYSGRFFSTSKSLGTNAVDIMRVTFIFHAYEGVSEKGSTPKVKNLVRIPILLG